MENTVATIMQNDVSNFDSLQEQILNSKSTQQKESERDVRSLREQELKEKEEPVASSKKYVFTKGDQSLELDDDYEMEIMADKKATRLTLRELRERAAGDIAIKNRMHSLAEEKKNVQKTFKQFADIAKTDPLAALEYISNKAKESDSEFEYKNYIEKLAEQAEKLGEMDDQERKSWELEKKLAKAEQDLSSRERTEAVVLRKQDILSTYPEIGDQRFGEMVDSILANDGLMDELQDENDFMDYVEELVVETLTQRDIVSVIKEINPKYRNDTALIFTISDQLRLNPDFDEEDVRDILRGIIGEQESSAPVNDKARDSRILSDKARQGATTQRGYQMQGASAYDRLQAQILERKKEFQKTPKNKR